MQLRICLFGPSGSGKSTIAKFIVERHSADLLKLSAPLHDMQKCFYERLRKHVGEQDGELLQFLAYKITKESPDWLGAEFLAKLERSSNNIVVNDDCRLNNYKVLLKAGFIFLRVQTPPATMKQRARPDHTAPDANHPVESGFENFTNRCTIYNGGDLQATLLQVEQVLAALSKKASH
jgi:shikimate kinase